MPFPLVFFLTPGHSIRKQPRLPAVPAAQVVGPAEVAVEVAVDAVVDVADAEAKKCRIWLEWVGARN
jgi:hypothetical protein